MTAYNLLLNLIVPGIIIIVSFLIVRFEKKHPISEKKTKLILLAIYMTGDLFSLWILSGGNRTPFADQAQVYSAASLLNEGNYTNLSPGGYVDMYVQQLGYITYLRIIFRIFGGFNYRAVQYINCLWIMGIIYMTGRCCRHFGDKSSVQILGSTAAFLFLPLHLLSSWVYGDIPFFFFQFAFLDSFLSYVKENKKKKIIPLILSAAFAILFRKNALIMLIAGAIAILFADRIKTRFRILLSALILIIPILTASALTYIYRTASGYELKGGIPAVCWISMGMNEEGKAGWFYNYCVPIYYSFDNDRDLVSEYVINDIKERASNPGYAAGFYSRKIFTQWNDPYYTTGQLLEVDKPYEATGISGFLAGHEQSVFRYLSSFQFMIYLFALIYALSVSRKKKLPENIILIYLLGGFLFSILWEANSRYVLQYLLALFPMAASAISPIIKKRNG